MAGYLIEDLDLDNTRRRLCRLLGGREGGEGGREGRVGGRGGDEREGRG